MTDDRRDNSAICARLYAIETALKAHISSDEIFIGKYGNLIDLLMVRETNNAKLRELVIERLVTGGVWAVVGFLFFASWEFIKRNLK